MHVDGHDAGNGFDSGKHRVRDAMPTENFKSKGAYERWNAYRHMHGIPAPNLKTAVVAGVAHTVKHGAAQKTRPAKKKAAAKGWQAFKKRR